MHKHSSVKKENTYNYKERLNKAGNLLSFIPGADKIIAIISMILGIAMNYIDEAVLSYIFMHKGETNAWKKACDAIVYALNKIIVDPLASIVMINDYYAAIEDQPLKSDLYATFSKASRKFKELIGKAEADEPTEGIPVEI